MSPNRERLSGVLKSVKDKLQFAERIHHNLISITIIA